MRQRETAAVSAGPRIAPIRLAQSKLSLIRDLAGALQSALVPLACIVFATGYCFDDLYVALLGTVLMFTANVVFGCLRLRERLLFLFLHAGIALFLLTRPVIGTLDEERTWMLSSPESTWFAIGSIFVSLVFLFLGVVTYGAVVSFNGRRRSKRDALRSGIEVVGASEEAFGRGARGYDGKGSHPFIRFVADLASKLKHSERIRYIRTASLLCFLVCYVAALYEGYIKLSYMSGLSYEEYYLINPDDHIPWIIGVLRPMMLYAFCSYLACMPRRRPTVICLVLYVSTTVPMLIIGSRSDFVIAFLFAALYFVLRAVTDTEERWITKRLVAVVCVAAPVGIFAMGAMNYTRAGSTIDGFGFLSLISDALFKQGVTFTVLGHGYDVNPQIQDLGFRFFSIGGITDTITQGFIGQTFFNVPDLGDANSALLALNGTSYAHTMSYFAHSNYLGGEGYGSSYILELYADFGFVGIIVGSFVLGVAFSILSTLIGRRWFGGMVALIAALAVFHMPRGAYIEWIDFVIATRFLLAVAVIVTLSALLSYASRIGLLPERVVPQKAKKTDEPSVVCAVDRSVPLVVCRAKANGARVNRHGVLVNQTSFTRVK